jgi:hypothetical protein
MPYYYRLRIRERDTDALKDYKKRVADRLLALRSALQSHIGGSSVDPEDLDEGARPDVHGINPSHFLRLATWNIREFDSNKFGRRLRESNYYIAEILSAFDLIAVQEVRDDLTALKKVMDILGPAWDYIATDVSEGSAGNRERMVFIYNTGKVSFRNIAGELVLPQASTIEYPHEERLRLGKEFHIELPDGTQLNSDQVVDTYRRSGKDRLRHELAVDLPEGTSIQLPAGSQLVLPRKSIVELTEDERVVLPEGSSLTFREDDPDRQVMVRLPKGMIVGESLQFARTPFLVAFQAGWLKFQLCTVHIYYGSDEEGMERRKEEIRRLTEMLSKRARREKDTDAYSFFIVLGDFNIVGRGHGTMRALTTNGFDVPKALHKLPGSNVDKSKAYDQIAYWTDPDDDGAFQGDVSRFEVHRAGVFDFFETVFRRGSQDPDGHDEAHYTGMDLYKSNWKYRDWRTHQMSDHLPMWIELRIDFGDEYLERIRKEGLSGDSPS